MLGLNDAVPPQVMELLTVTHRNGLRLQKLVNALLEFSFTAELASTFRATVEKAGLALTVDCPALPRPVYVDREMWEKWC
ncbi:MAG TPA: hypothetical protein VK686_24730 [Bryobacteraceae bacterium]|nr:hypothetical protein [Bryobacteraceae bacterium]